MTMGVESGPTKVWDCEACGARNVTRERDVFSDQCRRCTCYNQVDWTEIADVSLSEAATAAEEL